MTNFVDSVIQKIEESQDANRTSGLKKARIKTAAYAAPRVKQRRAG
jgi:hypothetical protein